MKKTKIICTMGPNTENRETMKQLVLNGMDIARFNFSHGLHEEHLGKLEILKSVREELDLPVAALLDTKGPEIRTGTLEGGKKVYLEEGQKYTLTTRLVTGNSEIGHVNYSELADDLTVGSTVLIDDGLIELKVEKIDGMEIECKVINGGELGERKGVNIPGVKTNLPCLTDKDREDILFGIENGFDFIAASFVRTADAVTEIKKMIAEHNSTIKVIAKIENEEGIENIDSIIEAADGIMIARGDMGVEIPPERVPHIQKMMIDKCSEACKPVITATQMLDSMIRNPRPTRAEVTDVANAVYDGTDVVMLSGETAMGKYPVEALKVMVKIVEETEHYLDYNSFRQRKISKDNKRNVANVVCNAAVLAASTLNAKAIIAPSFSGFTTMMLSKWKPEALVIGTSPNKEIVRQMQMYWGIIPMYEKKEMTTESLIDSAVDMLKGKDILRTDDTAVVIAGIVNKNSEERAGSTNLMKIITVK